MKLARCTLLLLCVTPGARQDPVDLTPPDPGSERSEPDEHAELIRLVQDVERTLLEIDQRLADAGAGETRLDAVEDAGLDALLRDSLRKSDEVVRAIDRIFEIRDHHPAGGGGGG